MRVAGWRPAKERRGTGALNQRLEENKHLGTALRENPQDEILSRQPPGSKPTGSSPHLRLWVRLLFSCLVDADRLGAEKFGDSGKAAERGRFPDRNGLAKKSGAYLSEKFSNVGDSPAGRARTIAMVLEGKNLVSNHILNSLKNGALQLTHI